MGKSSSYRIRRLSRETAITRAREKCSNLEVVTCCKTKQGATEAAERHSKNHEVWVICDRDGVWVILKPTYLKKKKA